MRLGAVMALPTSQEHPQRIAQPIDRRVNLATETATTPPVCLRAVFFAQLSHRDVPAQHSRGVE